MNSKALYTLTYGVYIVSSVKDGKFNAQVANTAMQVTSEPPRISVCINQQNLTCDYIRSSGLFCVTVLAQDTPVSVIGQFGFKSGREVDKFADIPYQLGETGLPILNEYGVACLELKVEKECPLDTHTLFIGSLVAADVLREGEPMTYAYYHQIKKGTVPKTAPHYIEEKKEEKPVSAAKYRCKVCGYVYDPEMGDPDGGIAPGTSFEDIPDDWECPICGAKKSEFEKIS